MKKLLEKLEAMVDVKLVEVNQTKGVYAGSVSYDGSQVNDSSTSYDYSNYYDYSQNGDA